MKDYSYNDRQRLISSAEKNPSKAHYQRLIKKGLHPDDATNLSGWSPIDEYQDWFAVSVYIFCASCVIAALVIFTQYAEANTAIPDLRRFEATVVSCLNGGEIRLDNGDRFACVPLMREGK